MLKIKKENINTLLEELMKDYQVYAPVKNGSKAAFKVIENPDDIFTGHVKSEYSPKSVFFPQSEVLFEYSKEGVSIPEKKEKPYLLWGVRNCDTKSIRMLDKVFGNARQAPDKDMYKDPYWKQKYDTSIIFNFACNAPLTTCFCNWFGSGPFDESGSDIFVVETKDDLIFKGISEKGKELLKKLSVSEISDKKDEEAVSELKEKAVSMMPEVTDISALYEKLPKLWNEPIWQEISSKCVNCGACAFICPTCHCFDVSDEGKNGKGKRVRLWDSCMFPIFTMEASGHNPRGNSVDRVRQRVMHKFNYFKDNYGTHLCTGCGRCVVVCPVNLDIRDVIKDIINYELNKKVPADV
ncbi:MAG: 4Fe-4S dicluster domain-containing protein [Candidatus Delongbacteria bacterium]|nr:4Fe-4S dicluster domain-containing protein [Candidatus Delongbacteria bacterium]MCG2761306.1 4Fe-4S dicluster domain-containing protein [Candidatus Delongbacteria bacterium]